MQTVFDNFTVLLMALVVMWIFQFGLAYFQWRRFYGRLAELRREGLTAIGLAGNQYKGLAYVVLTIDAQNRLLNNKKFSGWTVFTNLKPVPQLTGMSLDEILAEDGRLPVSSKLQAAFANAAKDLKRAREKQIEASEQKLAGTLQPA